MALVHHLVGCWPVGQAVHVAHSVSVILAHAAVWYVTRVGHTVHCWHTYVAVDPTFVPNW